MKIDLTPDPLRHAATGMAARADLAAKMIRFFLDQSEKEKAERLPYVLNAFPGTGKTYGSLLAAAYMLHTGMVEHVVYCVPWDNLREGAAKTARKLFGLEMIETKHPTHLLDLKDGFNKGAVVTYGQLNGKCGGPLASLCRDYRVLVIADEMHHLEENNRCAAFRPSSVMRT